MVSDLTVQPPKMELTNVFRSMNDVDGPVVARNVYERLLSEEDEYVDSSVIPYALVDATNELRARGVHPARWATYVHFGV